MSSRDHLQTSRDHSQTPTTGKRTFPIHGYMYVHNVAVFVGVLQSVSFVFASLEYLESVSHSFAARSPWLVVYAQSVEGIKM